MQYARSGRLLLLCSSLETTHMHMCTHTHTQDGRWVSFIGSHLDVVPADPSLWDRPPFKLVREGDTLWGRGVSGQCCVL